jgi:hypothetical protein
LFAYGEPGAGDNIFRDNTFKGVAIGDVVPAALCAAEHLHTAHACHLVIPITHQPMARDAELAREAQFRRPGLVRCVLGGHDHDVIDEDYAGCRV